MNNPGQQGHPAGTDRPSGMPRPIAWMDGRVVPASEATVPFADDGFLRGDAVFESVMVRRGRTHLLDAHLSRMRRSAQHLGIRLPVMRHVVTDLLAAWGERDGAIRLYVTRGGTVRGLIEAHRWPPSVALATLDIPWQTALTGVKTVSYVVNQWAIRSAKERNADDALIVNGDTVLELPTGSVFLVIGDALVTPDPEQLPILDSITVQAIAELAGATFEVLTLNDLRRADEVFVASATRPILPVHTVLIDDEEVSYPAPGPRTEELHAAFAAAIEDSLDTES